MRDGRFLDALRLLGKPVGAPLKGTLDFNIDFDPERLIALDGRDRPSCDEEGEGSALALLERAKEDSRAAAAVWLLEGAVLVCAGRHREALESLERAGSLSPREPWVWMWKFLARCRGNFMSGKTYEMQEALKDLDRAIVLDPANPRAYAWRARCLKAMTFVGRALKDIDRVLELRPGDHWARAIRGNLRAELGLAEAAMDDCAHLVTLFPGKSWVLAQRARVRARCSQGEGSLKACLEDLDAAMSLEPGRSMYHAWRGEVLRLLGRHEEADSEFRRAAGLKPRYPIALLWLAKLRILEGNYEKAADILDEIMPEIPGNELAPLYRWQARLCLGRFEAALEDYFRIAHRRPEQTWTPRPKDGAVLRRILDGLLKRHGESAWALAWRGILLACLEEPETMAALTDLNRALSIEPEHPWARLWRAQVLHKLEGPRRALPEFERACALNPSARSLGWLGRTLLELGDLPGALSRLEASLAIDPDDDELRAAFGEALVRARRFPEALEELTELRSAILQTAEAYCWRAQALAGSADAAGALEAVEEAVRLRPRSSTVRLLKARLLRESGRLGEALAELAQARNG